VKRFNYCKENTQITYIQSQTAQTRPTKLLKTTNSNP